MIFLALKYPETSYLYHTLVIPLFLKGDQAIYPEKIFPFTSLSLPISNMGMVKLTSSLVWHEKEISKYNERSWHRGAIISEHLLDPWRLGRSWAQAWELPAHRPEDLS